MNHIRIPSTVKVIMAILSLALVVSLIVLMTGCGNKQVFDTTYTFNTAILELPDGSVVKGAVQSWTDYEDGDQIQVKIDGKTYLIHSTNICLMAN